MRRTLVAALLLAPAPAFADAFMVAALDRCLPGLYQSVVEGKKDAGCARYVLVRCDGRPDPAACEAAVNRAVRTRIADLTSSPGAPSVPRTVPANGFDCRSAFSGSYCDIWDEAGRLDAVVVSAARARIHLDFAKPGAVADDLDLPVRLFDRCLERAAAAAAARSERPSLGPDGLMCTEFFSVQCRIMADPTACVTHVRARLQSRLKRINPPQSTRWRVLPEDRPHHSAEEVALANLALQFAERRLTSSAAGAP